MPPGVLSRSPSPTARHRWLTPRLIAVEGRHGGGDPLGASWAAVVLVWRRAQIPAIADCAPQRPELSESQVLNSAAPPRFKRRRTLGVLADYMNASGSTYESELRDAIHARCRDKGYDLLVIYGRSLEDPAPSSGPHNAIFNLVGPEAVDGLLLISSCLASFTGTEGITRLARRYRAIPMCSIGLALPDIPSIISDSRSGMDAVLDHILSDHGCRRVGFVAGSPENPEASLRFEAYRSALERHGIPFDRTRVAHGAFAKEHACQAVGELLRRAGPLDAIVAANDAMAAGTIEALRKAGQRVPRDVLVTGYDDLQFARLGNPPLTTVRQPLEAMADAAVRLLLDQMEGRAAPLCTELPTRMVVRRSCGCNLRAPRSRTPPVREADMRTSDYVRCHDAQLLDVLTACLTVNARDPTADARRLLGGLVRELDGQADSFVRVVEDIVEESANDDERGRALQLALIALRQELSEIATARMEDVWHEASAIVALANGTGRALHRLTTDEHYFQLMHTAELTVMALDIPALESVLQKLLPELGIRTAFLSRYTSRECDELESFVSLWNGLPVDPEARRFPSRQLIPPGVRSTEQPHTSLVYPMAYDGQPLGVAVFAYDDPMAAYNTVRDQISVALRNIELHEEILKKTMLHERSVQERLATSKRIESLSILAGGVAHDLNNALSPLVALPDIMLAELAQLSVQEGRLDELRADVETIKVASLQAAQTIKDLLTLGRQGRLAKKPLNLNELVRVCTGAVALRCVRDERPEVDVAVEFTPEPLLIRGSAAQLTRAITNLIHNAVEAIDGRGQVAIQTGRARLTEPLSGYEAIEPGEYATVAVSDDGIGIAASELSRIFEPFFSKKRLADRSGTGLGLAIVHGVAKEHLGYVDVTSIVGQGTTFTLYFPVTEEPVRMSVPPPSVRSGSARILLVDDEPLLLRTCRRVLGRQGYHIDTLDSGQRALDLFVRAATSGQSPYDVVVVDMILNEEQDGLQVFERIRELFPGQRGIVVSGHAPTERAERAIQEGLSWLAKPYTAEVLARTVQEVLGQAPARVS